MPYLRCAAGMASASFFSNRARWAGLTVKCSIREGAAGSHGCGSAFGYLLVDWSVGAVGVGVELQQPFGQLAVVESRSGDDGGYYVFVAAIGGKQVYACSVETGAERVEFREEGEVVDAVYDFGRVGAGLRRSSGPSR